MHKGGINDEFEFNLTLNGDWGFWNFCAHWFEVNKNCVNKMRIRVEGKRLKPQLMEDRNVRLAVSINYFCGGLVSFNNLRTSVLFGTSNRISFWPWEFLIWMNSSSRVKQVSKTSKNCEDFFYATCFSVFMTEQQFRTSKSRRYASRHMSQLENSRKTPIHNLLLDGRNK